MTSTSTSTSTSSSVDGMMTTSKIDNENIPDMSIDVPAEVTTEEASMDDRMDDSTTSLPLDMDATESDDTVDEMTSAEVTTTVSEESESVTEASIVGYDTTASEKTTTASVIDGESSTLSQDEKSM